MYTVLLATTFW